MFNSRNASAYITTLGKQGQLNAQNAYCANQWTSQMVGFCPVRQSAQASLNLKKLDCPINIKPTKQGS